MTDIEPVPAVVAEPARPVGWYLTADGKTKRRWNGVEWTNEKQTPAGWYPHPTMAATQQYWDGENWTANIAPGSPSSQAVVVNAQGKAYKTSHGFHLIMSIITLGMWAIFVWLPIGIYNAVKNGK